MSTSNVALMTIISYHPTIFLEIEIKVLNIIIVDKHIYFEVQSYKASKKHEIIEITISTHVFFTKLQVVSINKKK